MLFIHRIHAAAALLFIFCAPAWAQDYGASSAQQGAQRLCKSDSLTGHTYKMVDFNETPPRGETQWINEFPYNYLVFFRNNGYNAVAIDREIKDVKQIQAFLSPIPGQLMNYTLSNDGVLTLMDNGVIMYTYRCVEVLKSAGDYIEGDLVLKGYTKKRRSELYKLFRRWY